jgi:glycosyltransferase involved in cell wall biosynthesis
MASALPQSRYPDGILLIHWSFPPTTGGVESHLADLAKSLAAQGRRIVVLTGEEQPIRHAAYDVISTPLLDLRRIKAGTLPSDELRRDMGKLLADVVERYEASVIHGHNLHHFHSGPALAIDELRRKRALRVHHTFHETWPDLLRENPVYRSWSGNYAVSRFVQEQCHSALGFRPDLFPLAVDTTLFNSGTRCLEPDHVAVILHPARLLPWKGVDISIRALRLLLDRGHRATLTLTDTQRIADWNNELVTYRAEIHSLVSELGLESHVGFASVSYSEMPRLYERADIVVYPTIGDEPYGLVPLEAMSCGRPIIASRSGGIPETVVDGVTGYVVPRNDPHRLADRLGDLLSDPEMARRMGAAGRRHVEHDFNFADYTTALLRRFAADDIPAVTPGDGGLPFEPRPSVGP